MSAAGPQPRTLRDGAHAEPVPGVGALVLAIETSCDDTSVAVLERGVQLRSHLIAAQDVHQLYGGVVPELASRAHVVNVIPVLDEEVALRSLLAEWPPGLVDEIAKYYTIDPKRVFLVGHSNGGAMSFRLGCDAPERFAAIVDLAGPFFMDATKCKPKAPVKENLG
ncbi:MAG: prolyl oligopeptidase family serine peptidase [Candidatus Eisenbacteria bacterium]